MLRQKEVVDSTREEKLKAGTHQEHNVQGVRNDLEDDWKAQGGDKQESPKVCRDIPEDP